MGCASTIAKCGGENEGPSRSDENNGKENAAALDNRLMSDGWESGRQPGKVEVRLKAEERDAIKQQLSCMDGGCMMLQIEKDLVLHDPVRACSKTTLRASQPRELVGNG